LECGDLSPLWSAATYRDQLRIASSQSSGRQAALDQSGDRSPHSDKVDTSDITVRHYYP